MPLRVHQCLDFVVPFKEQVQQIGVEMLALLRHEVLKHLILRPCLLVHPIVGKGVIDIRDCQPPPVRVEVFSVDAVGIAGANNRS